MDDEVAIFEVGEHIGWQPPVLTTSRLQIRPLSLQDAPALHIIDSDPQMTRYTLWETHNTMQDTLDFIERYAASRVIEQVPDPLGVVQKNGILIGTVGAFWVAKPHGVMELGYNIGVDYWGQGYASEATQALIAYVFSHYDVTRLQARVFAENTASAKVMEKLNFRYEGMLRSLIYHRGQFKDVCMYSLLKTEWEYG
jgi:[ribosomal protein S5]-alanine N-acetyltransferase